MSCKTCGGEATLELCLHCGYSYCGNHRGTIDGGVACTGCLRGEQERRAKGQAARAQREERARVERSAVPAAAGSGPAPLAPLPEPAGWGPVGYGLLAGAASGSYALWLFRRLREPHELPTWSPWAAGVVIGLAVAAGVWAIAKTHAKR